MPVFWDGLPSSDPRIPIQVFWVRPGPATFIRLLADPQGVWLHWIETRCLPCMGEDCCWCQQHMPQRWKCYVPALVWQTRFDESTKKREGRWIPVVFEMTESVAQDLGENLRGKIIEVSRRGLRNNSPLQAKFVEKQVKGEIPPAFDVRPILERLWGIRQRRRPEKSDQVLKFKPKGGQNEAAI